MSASSVLSIIAPQFDTVAGRDDFISLATLQVNTCVFGEKADLAIAYLSAHLIQVSQDSVVTGGSSGEITSKKEGDLAISFGNFAPKDGSGLNATSWGRQFQMLQEQVTLNIGVTNGLSLYEC